MKQTLDDRSRDGGAARASRPIWGPPSSRKCPPSRSSTGRSTCRTGFPDIPPPEGLVEAAVQGAPGRRAPVRPHGLASGRPAPVDLRPPRRTPRRHPRPGRRVHDWRWRLLLLFAAITAFVQPRRRRASSSPASRPVVRPAGALALAGGRLAEVPLLGQTTAHVRICTPWLGAAIHDRTRLADPEHPAQSLHGQRLRRRASSISWQTAWKTSVDAGPIRRGRRPRRPRRPRRESPSPPIPCNARTRARLWQLRQAAPGGSAGRSAGPRGRPP